MSESTMGFIVAIGAFAVFAIVIVVALLPQVATAFRLLP